MNRINEIDNTIEGKETKTYYQDHPELVVLSGRLYGKVTYAEYFDAYYLQFGDNVYYFPQKDSYQEGRNWKKKKFDSYEECLNFSQQHNIKIVMKSTVKSPFSNGLPDSRFLFPKRNTPYNPSERTDVSRIRENKHNTYYNMNKKLIRLTESDLHKIVKESVNKILNESIDKTYITYDGIKLLLSMNGDDIYIEYTENDRWILARYYANEKLWVVQENLDHQMVADGEDNIITIAKTKSMPEALAKMSQYIKHATHQYIDIKQPPTQP